MLFTPLEKTDKRWEKQIRSSRNFIILYCSKQNSTHIFADRERISTSSTFYHSLFYWRGKNGVKRGGKKIKTSSKISDEKFEKYLWDNNDILNGYTSISLSSTSSDLSPLASNLPLLYLDNCTISNFNFTIQRDRMFIASLITRRRYS